MATAIKVREIEVQEPVEASRPQPARPLIRQVPVGRLFEDVLLESSGLQRRRRALAGVLSIIFQFSLLGTLILIPLMFTDALPKQQLLTFLIVPPPPPPPPPAAAAAKAVQPVKSDLIAGNLRTPSRIPQKIQMIREDEPPPDLSSGGVVGGVPGGIPGGQMGGVIGGILSSTSSLSAIPKMSIPTAPKRIRISQGVTRGQLVTKVEAKYPPLALIARIQGVVVLTAIISKTGEIQNLSLVSGQPLLVPAAIEAVKQWRYRPFQLNGEAVEVETTVTVTFQLSS
jgi:periplasmic protein TonB